MSDGPTALGSPQKSVRRTLADLFDDRTGIDAEWSSDDLISMWRHQLAMPLHEVMSFRDALLTETGSLESLQAVKDFAKQCLTSTDQSIPKSIGWMLYITAVAAAMKRFEQRITSADDATLQEWLHWASSQSWIDDQTRALVK